MIDFQKNKTKIIALGTGLVICIALFVATMFTGPKREDAPSAPTGQKQILEAIQKTMFESSWEEMDKASSPLEAEDGWKAPEPPEEPPAPKKELSVYPSPSYVSECGDTLVFRNSVYVRTGPAETRPEIDTVTIDGKTYIRWEEEDSSGIERN